MTRIHYISHGLFKTGGYRHEYNLYQSCVQFFSKTRQTKQQIFRLEKQFDSIFKYFQLLIWSFFKSNANINIVSLRTAIPAILRNYFNKNEVWIVLHNHDESDNKSSFLRKYTNYLFKILQNTNHKRFKVIAVAPYWSEYFQKELKLPQVFYFPNLYDTEVYKNYHQNETYPWIHLGQFSTKNDPQITQLAEKLSRDGYYCFFSTLDPASAKPNNGAFEVLYFNDFNDYLNQISHCCCTLALSKVKEGWNRVAHESILLGTPVIGYSNAGLGDLLKLSNSVTVRDIHEAYECIKASLWVLPDSSFSELFDIHQGPKLIQSICQN